MALKGRTGPGSLVADERIEPRIREAFSNGVEEAWQAHPCFDTDVEYSTKEQVMEQKYALLKEWMAKYGSAPAAALPDEVVRFSSLEGLTSKRVHIQSAPDGNSVPLRVIRPDTGVLLPLVVHLHGGGMGAFSAEDPSFATFLKILARQGVAVVGPDFRNFMLSSESNPELAPYPGGLNDCLSAVLWCYEHAAELGLDRTRIILTGDSGGANLAMGVAMKLKRMGRPEVVSGLYLIQPYVAGMWPSADEKEAMAEMDGIVGDSHLTNFGIFFRLPYRRNAALGYGVEAFKAKDPLAWAGFATLDDLKGLPRCVVSMAESDPLRDEGINLYRRLLKAGVPARARVDLGLPHNFGVSLCTMFVDLAVDTARLLASFAFTDDRFHECRPLAPIAPASSKL